MARLLLGFFLLGTAILLAACLSMGMPEYVAQDRGAGVEPIGLRDERLGSLDSPKSDGARVLLLLPDDPPFSLLDEELGRSETLGHQYIFGIFPVTNLYFQHSAQAFLSEVMLDVVRRQGFEWYTAQKRNAAVVRDRLKPDLILEMRAEEIEVNAFDLFIVRRVRLQAELALDIIDISEGGESLPIRTVRRRSEKGFFRRHGHAWLLSTEFARLLAEDFHLMLEGVVKGHRPGSTPAGQLLTGSLSPGDATVILVPFPHFDNPPPPRLGELLVSSYGFQGVPVIENGGVLRLIQRAAATGLQESDIVVSASSVSSERVVRNPDASGLWALEIGIDDISISLSSSEGKKECIEMSLLFRLSENRSLLQAKCFVYQDLVEGVDGNWIWTLERAIYRAVRTFVGGPAVAGEVSCEALS